MASRNVLSMEEFLEEISLQQQAVALELRRKQRQSSSKTDPNTTAKELLEAIDLQERMAIFEKKKLEKQAQVQHPNVIEMFGELYHPEPSKLPSLDESSSSAPVTSSEEGGGGCEGNGRGGTGTRD
ncbi:unnamed protein product [Cuscuta epithymum]|uniref:Uncharacterized protein n=1 Tax=Cuscuta epithymum TaxID=186058 RepID=A0AAV0C2T9_9ASTE|nr:unnamed protein product [Cuscuta epithymum]